MIIRFEYMRTITVDGRLEIKRVIRAEHPDATEEEVKAIFAERLMDKALAARAKERLFFDLSERIKKDELLVRGPAQDALLAEHALTLTLADKHNIYAEASEVNPTASTKEHEKAFRALRVQAALAWRTDKQSARRKEILSLTDRKVQAN